MPAKAKRPASVPAEAVWDPSDSEWVLMETDEQGRPHGLGTFWRPDGTLVNHCHYEHGTPHGSYKRYHENGEVSRQGTWVAGVLHGTDLWFRSTAETTENFPQVADAVARLEMDMHHGQVADIRCFDAAGKRLTQDGKPHPRQPKGLPETAKFDCRDKTWIDGKLNEKGKRQGEWRVWAKDGTPRCAVGYDDGAEQWKDVYASPEHAAALRAIRADDGPAAMAAALAWWKQAEAASDAGDIARAGAVLLRACALSGDATTALACAKTVVGNVPANIWQFTDEGRSQRLGLALAYDLLANERLAAGDATAALAFAQQAQPHADDLSMPAPKATLVRVLLAAGNEDEAYAAMQAYQTANLPEQLLQELIASPAYAAWKVRLEAIANDPQAAESFIGHGGGKLAELAQLAGGKAPDAQPPVATGDAGGVDVRWDLIASLGDGVSPELRCWIELDMPWRLPPLHRGDHHLATASTVSAAVAVEDGCWIARLQSLFMGLATIRSEDEQIWFAAWQGDANGDSRLYAIHQDEPGDWSAMDCSLAVYLAGWICDEHGFDPQPKLPAMMAARLQAAAKLAIGDDALPPHRDPEALEPRTRWIVELLLDQDVLEDAAGNIPGKAVWEAETGLLPGNPHLQAYWLLHHLACGNTEALATVLQSADRRHPAVAELAAAAERVRAGADDGLPFWDEARLTAFRRGMGKAGMLKAAAARNRKAGAKAASAKVRAEAALEQLTEQDYPKARAAWRILSRSVGQRKQWSQQLISELYPSHEQLHLVARVHSGQASMIPLLLRGFLDEIDGRWRPLLEATLEAECKLPEAKAMPGVLAGLGMLMKDFPAFQQLVASQPFHPKHNGPERRLEQALVAERLWGQAGTLEFLRGEAERFVDQIDSWESDTFHTALMILVRKRDPVGCDLLRREFADADYSGANWWTLLAHASEFRANPHPALAPAMQAALERGFGNPGNGARAVVAHAYARCAGPAATAVLEQRLAAAEDAAERLALLGGLMAIDPARATQAREALEAVLEDGLEEDTYGAAVGLLQVAAMQQIGGFARHVAAIASCTDGDDGMKAWLDENGKDVPA